MFCSQCGVKLDLRNTASDDLKHRRVFDIAGLVRRILKAGLMILILGVAVLAFWPETIPEVEFDSAGVEQMPIKARAIYSALSLGRRASMNISEGEMNGFLAARARNKDLQRLVIDFTPGAFVLYAARDWQPLAYVTTAVDIRIPFTVSLRGSFNAGVLMVEEVRYCHLILPGFAAGGVVNSFASVFADVLREHRIVSSLKSVVLEETKADVVLEP